MRKRLHIGFPPGVTMLIGALEQSGFEAYAVGGCVRDALLGKIPADWDICTNARPEQICRCFAAYHLLHAGMKYGTVTIVIGHQSFEITSYRIDGAYSDHRRPDGIRFSDSLEIDLARRDFTVNAMACHPQKGLVDLYNGAQDLRTGVIRCVGDPNARFQEDALRILRALRFSAVYDFSIIPQTTCSIHMHAPLLAQVAVERVTAELCKLLCGIAAQRVLDAFPDVLAAVIPSLAKQMQQPDFSERWQQATSVIAYAAGNLYIALAELAHISVKQYGITEYKSAYEAALDWSMERKLDRATGKAVAMLVANRNATIPTDTSGLKRLMRRLGAKQTLLFIAAHRVRMLAQAERCAAEQMRQAQERVMQMIDAKVCFNRAGLAVNGSDLKQIGITDGKVIGNLLDQMVLWVIDGEIENEKELILETIRLMNVKKL